MGLKMGYPIRNHYISITELSIAREQLFHKTASRNLRIEKFIAFPYQVARLKQTRALFPLFANLDAEIMAINFPALHFSPKYSAFLESTSTVRVICYRLNLEQFALSPYTAE